MKTHSFLFLLLFCTHLCVGQATKEKTQYQAFGRCDGCEGMFEYGDRMLQPIDTLPDFKKHEPKLKVTGVIYNPDGKTPAADVIMYVYQTNPEGKYPIKGDEEGWAKRHGYIRGWIKTDSSGKYTFYTFQPGSYGSGPAHIHAVVLEPNGKYYYIDDYNFEGDPYLSKENENKNEGGSGLVKLRRAGNILLADRNIILGLNIPGYE